MAQFSLSLFLPRLK
ncbi:Protein of unknown function [Lactobacillus acidophilus DSM 20079 = JCM 1132 = NBRC 13951 = CIP 76.13]|nr:Protein of unknown function [Lactobacillus acidophilus DSM 20079 = JCM 1132 = NBRC 13951 = CIP 76.13]CDF69341.1 Protein of unknown function [Lactobacillus acidophilus CIRM-BIA 442]CDF74915.1 Protein of unknown function [Lactobacillus acidophilus DSM 20242]